MDLREKFIEDLFEVMREKDKATPDLKDISREDMSRAQNLAEGMLKKGWFFNQEKGTT